MMPSPLIPVSSAARIPRLGATVGPWVSIVKLRGRLMVEPKPLVAFTCTVYGPSGKGFGNGRMKLPLASLVPVAEHGPGGVAAGRQEQLHGDVRVGRAEDVRLRVVGDPLAVRRVVERGQADGRLAGGVGQAEVVRLEDEAERGDVPLRPRGVGRLDPDRLHAVGRERRLVDLDRELAERVGLVGRDRRVLGSVGS